MHLCVFDGGGRLRGQIREADFAATMRAALLAQTMLELQEAEGAGAAAEWRAAIRAKADRAMRAWGPMPPQDCVHDGVQGRGEASRRA